MEKLEAEGRKMIQERMERVERETQEMEQELSYRPSAAEQQADNQNNVEMS